jgi:hypothetical protein
MTCLIAPLCPPRRAPERSVTPPNLRIELVLQFRIISMPCEGLIHCGLIFRFKMKRVARIDIFEPKLFPVLDAKGLGQSFHSLQDVFSFHDGFRLLLPTAAQRLVKLHV